MAGLAAGQSRGADTETQHGFDVSLPLRSNVNVLLHSRVRTRPRDLGFYQVRTGPIVTWDWTSRVAVLGGYYFARQENIDFDFLSGHRAFGGAEVNLAGNGRAELDARAVYERFLPDEARDFNRYRFRQRLSGKARAAPYASHEVFLDAHGWRSSRFSGGVRWKAARYLELDAGYFYEARRNNIGRDRHMWITSVHIKRSLKRGDPDI